MEEKEKVTRDALREMKDGETRVFRLEDAQACYSGKSQAYILQNILQCKFTCEADFANNTLTITRNPS